MIAVYLRVSTEKQDEAMQRAAINHSLDANEGTNTPARLGALWYTDIGISGTTTKRPGYEALLADITNGRVHKLIVYEYSRLWRDLEEQNRVLKILMALNIELYSVKEGTVKTIEDEFKANILGSANVYEAKRTRQRVIDGIKAKKEAVAKGLDVWKGRGPDKNMRKRPCK